jgi:hypothetical protein
VAPTSSTITCSITSGARPAQHRLFSSAVEPSSVEVDSAASTRNDPLVSKEDEHVEEKKRGRLSDVRYYQKLAPTSPIRFLHCIENSFSFLSLPFSSLFFA